MVTNWKVLMNKIGGPTGNGQEKGITESPGWLMVFYSLAGSQRTLMPSKNCLGLHGFIFSVNNTKEDHLGSISTTSRFPKSPANLNPKTRHISVPKS